MTALDSNPYSGKDSDSTGTGTSSRMMPETLDYGQINAPDTAADVEERIDQLPEKMESLANLLDNEPAKTMDFPGTSPTPTIDFPVESPAAGESALQAGSDSQSADGDGESIEDYMSRLLARVNQGGDSTYEPPPSNPKPAVEKSYAPQPVSSDPQAADASATPSPTVEEKPAEVRQPAKAPEGRDDLQNLRELANASAHNAIRTHSCKQIVSQMYGRLAFAGFAIAFSCLMAFISTTVWSLCYVVAIVSMLTAVVGVWRFHTLARQLSKFADAEFAEQSETDVVTQS